MLFSSDSWVGVLGPTIGAFAVATWWLLAISLVVLTLTKIVRYGVAFRKGEIPRASRRRFAVSVVGLVLLGVLELLSTAVIGFVLLVAFLYYPIVTIVGMIVFWLVATFLIRFAARTALRLVQQTIHEADTTIR